MKLHTWKGGTVRLSSCFMALQPTKTIGPVFAKFISPAYHLVALDLPGFGESTCLEDASYSIEDQAKRLNRFADAVGLKKFHIVGNSMGGLIAARYTVMFLPRGYSRWDFSTQLACGHPCRVK